MKIFNRSTLIVQRSSKRDVALGRERLESIYNISVEGTLNEDLLPRGTKLLNTLLEEGLFQVIGRMPDSSMGSHKKKQITRAIDNFV